MTYIRLSSVCIALVSVLALSACGEDDVDPTGEYTVAVTNGENGCMFANWTVGQQASGISLTITNLADGTVTADVGGATRVVLDLILGKHVFTGSVDGDELNLTATGEQGVTEGNCAYTLNADVDATLDGDFLEGTITYRFQTNQGTDCGYRDTCTTVQAFNGTRPPR
jgi:hypothetical protein